MSVYVQPRGKMSLPDWERGRRSFFVLPSSKTFEQRLEKGQEFKNSCQFRDSSEGHATSIIDIIAVGACPMRFLQHYVI